MAEHPCQQAEGVQKGWPATETDLCVYSCFVHLSQCFHQVDFIEQLVIGLQNLQRHGVGVGVPVRASSAPNTSSSDAATAQASGCSVSRAHALAVLPGRLEYGSAVAPWLGWTVHQGPD